MTDVFEGINIEDNSFSTIGKYPEHRKVISRFLNSMGIEQVRNPQTLSEDNAIYDKITLVVDADSCAEWRLHLNEAGVEDSASYTPLFERFDKWRIENMGERSSSYTPTRFEKTAQLLTLNNGTFIGCYYPERNMIWLAYNPFEQTWGNKRNEPTIIKSFVPLKEALDRIKVVKADISDKLLLKQMDMFKKGLVDAKNTSQNRINSATAEVTAGRNQLINGERIIFTEKKNIEALSRLENEMKDSLMNELNEIKQLPFVKNVGVVAEGISVSVGKLSMMWKGTKTYLGDYTFILSPKKIKVKNPTPVIKEGSNYEHPHVHQEQICLGDAEADMYSLLASLQLKKLVYNLYCLLKTYNPESPHCPIEYWILQRNEKYDGDGNLLAEKKTITATGA